MNVFDKLIISAATLGMSLDITRAAIEAPFSFWGMLSAVSVIYYMTIIYRLWRNA